MTLSPRARTVLSRFPRHLALDAPGSLFGAVVHGLAGHLDRLTADLGRVRRAHRLGEAQEQVDLRRLAGLHGLREELFDVTLRRLAALGPLAEALADPATRATALAVLPDAMALAGALWPAEGGETDDQIAARMAGALLALTGHAAWLQAQRRLVVELIAVHRGGNGSPLALLHAAAALLQLETGALHRRGDDFWHLLEARDRLRPEAAPAPRADWLALEENPEEAVDLEPTPRAHRERFTLQRLGFGPVATDVILVARDERCFWPMLVDVGRGHALVYADRLAAGQTLRWRASGLVELDGVEAGARAFSIDGGVFADAAAAVPGLDFVFGDADDPQAYGDRVATFGVCRPVASAADGLLPHAGGRVPPITLAVGSTRLCFFVREATFGSEAQGAADAGDAGDAGEVPAAPQAVAALPIWCAGRFDGAVWADAAAAPAADIGFAWRERQPYTCTLWLPRRFATLDDAPGSDAPSGRLEVRERIRQALERFRPAGVYLAVEYADDRWSLGHGVLREAGSVEPEGLIVHGTRLWPAPAPPA